MRKGRRGRLAHALYRIPAVMADGSKGEVAGHEDEGYEGHSLTMLTRIAGALNRRVHVLVTGE